MNNLQVFFNINIKKKKIDFLITKMNEPNSIFFKNCILDESNIDQFFFLRNLK